MKQRAAATTTTTKTTNTTAAPPPIIKPHSRQEDSANLYSKFIKALVDDEDGDEALKIYTCTLSSYRKAEREFAEFQRLKELEEESDGLYMNKSGEEKKKSTTIRKRSSGKNNNSSNRMMGCLGWLTCSYSCSCCGQGGCYRRTKQQQQQQQALKTNYHLVNNNNLSISISSNHRSNSSINSGGDDGGGGLRPMGGGRGAVTVMNQIGSSSRQLIKGGSSVTTTRRRDHSSRIGGDGVGSRDHNKKNSIGVLEEDVFPSAPLVFPDDGSSSNDDCVSSSKLEEWVKRFFLTRMKQQRDNPLFLNLLLRRKKHKQSGGGDITTEPEAAHDNLEVDASITTALHEAARIGSEQLLSRLLRRGGDLNIKDGMGRTPLHNICGGITQSEEEHLRILHYDNIIVNDQSSSSLVSKMSYGASSIPSRVGIRNFKRQRKLEEEEEEQSSKKPPPSHDNDPKLPAKSSNEVCHDNNHNRHLKVGGGVGEAKDEISEVEEKKGRFSSCYDNVALTRLQCIHIILNWATTSTIEDVIDVNISYTSQQQQQQSAVSLNAVDKRGRTALHYAAELGREDLCDVLVSKRVILTLIDENGKTPCELAGENHHHELAAKLEARSVLCEDNENDGWILQQTLLTAARIGSNDMNALVVPFNWFEVVDYERAEACMNDTILDVSRNMNAHIKYIYLARASGKEPLAIAIRAHKTNQMINERGSPDFLSSVDVAKMLEHFKWSPEGLMKAFRLDVEKVIDEVGISLDSPVENLMTTTTCEICLEEFEPLPDQQWHFIEKCNHGFCKVCLSDFIDAESKLRQGFRMKCPMLDCNVFLTRNDLEAVSSEASMKRILESETENFISSAYNFVFCPFPGCGNVIKCNVPESLRRVVDYENSTEYLPAVCTIHNNSNSELPLAPNICTNISYEGVRNELPSNSETVQPTRAHRFCFSCCEAPHWPASCKDTQRWNDKVSKEIEKVSPSAEGNSTTTPEDLAQKMWLKTNTRPCPKCHVPIEKDQGCNHMTCTNKSCSHEYCWICMQPWKLHNNKTGGFFRCNIWQEDNTEKTNGDSTISDDGHEQLAIFQQLGERIQYGTAQYDHIISTIKNRIMTRFLHHYSRYSAHKDSYELELAMAESVSERLTPVLLAARDFVQQNDIEDENNKNIDKLSFVHNAFYELLECRSMLQNSYILAFYRYDTNTKKFVIRRRKERVLFEYIQSELEMLTEQLSDLVGRSHLRATQAQIKSLTQAAAQKRVDMYDFVYRTSLQWRDLEKAIAEQSASAAGDNNNNNNKVDRPIVIRTDRMINEIINTLISTRVNSDRRGDYHDPISAFFRPGAEYHEYFTRFDRIDNYNNNNNNRRGNRGATNAAVSDDAMQNFAALEWECSACTFWNTAGIRCSMCGTRMNI